MRRCLILVLFMLSFISCGGDVPQKKASSAYKEGEIIVKFKSGNYDIQSYNTHNIMSAKSIKKLGITGLERVKLPQGISVPEAIQAYKAHPDVEYAEPNYIVRASAIPNDARFGEQWGLHNTGQNINGFSGKAGADIDAPGAWNILQVTSVIVAVIDSGIDISHPDIAANLVAGYDFVENDNIPDDLNGHGTHVTGIVGAVGNNAIGITGVGWSVKIMPLKVLDQNGEGAIADIIEAINYAVLNNARVINMSFSGTDFSKSLYDSIASYPNVLFVAAAGNGGEDNIGKDNDNPLYSEYPASFNLPNIISVAASDQYDNLTLFSNYGLKSVDVAAPGANILSTIPSFITGVTYSGTYRVVYFSFGFEGINGANVRRDIMQRVLEFNSITQSDKILLVDDDGGDPYENYYTASLQGYTFDVYTVPFGSNGPPLSSLNQYKLVIWFTGREFSDVTPITLTAIDQANIQAYMDNGGRLFLTGQDIGYEIGSTSFYQNYLHVLYVTDDALGNAYTGQNTFSNLSADISGAGDGAQYTRFVDAITPLGSQAAFYIHYNDAYQFLDGTSMATPVVSGIAALAGSLSGSLTAEQIKGTILGSVDVLPSLQGKILTGGRVNAYKTLISIASIIPPSNLSAQLQGTDIILAWTDNSTGESGFKIERKESGGQFEEIASVNANQTGYTDKGLKAGKTYSYRVRAFNTVAYSAYSNESQSIKIPGGNGGNGGGGGGCSIGTVHNVQTAMADMLVLFMPLLVIVALRRHLR
ncbi:MAG: hypothetical protein FJ240_07380 [Nitrospira sp.]|nr:hypothetical protein [Nitrospira sp.]